MRAVGLDRTKCLPGSLVVNLLEPNNCSQIYLVGWQLCHIYFLLGQTLNSWEAVIDFLLLVIFWLPLCLVSFCS